MPLLTKPLLPAVIPVVPAPVPQRNDREHFAERGDKMMAWMPLGMAGVQQHSNYVAAAAAYIEQESERTQQALTASQDQALLAEQWAGNAMITAHYKGPWNTLAGALHRPACVSHGGLFYALTGDIADVALAEPGGSESWAVLPGLTEIGTPINQSPVGDAVVGSSSAIVLQGSPFASVYASDAFAASQWQLHTFDSFHAPLYDSGTVAGAASFVVPAAVVGGLENSTRYYWRCRHMSSRGKWSAWSRASSFVTAATVGQYIPVPAATPATLGAAFQGGYYCGMVWQEIARTSEPKIIAVGALTKFNLDAEYDMYTKPIVYIGQTLEVRSRANPANNFKGIVVSANARTLTLNVTAVSGGGTFADWSVMARFRCILAPKASGQAQLKIKATDTALPAGCATIADGLASTLAMVAAGDAAMYPLAHWARGLTIGGYTDWYIPARDELELLPRTFAFIIWYAGSGARANAAIHNYTRNGAYGDVAGDAHGSNRNSAPPGTAYAASGGLPVTSITAFMTNGSEVLSGNVNGHYMSSTEHAAGSVWCMQLGDDSGLRWRQAQQPNAGVYNWSRAMRRSII